MGVDDFNDPLDFTKINAVPADLPPVPPQPREQPKRAVDDGQRFIAGQLLSANYAFQTRDLFISGERNLRSAVNVDRWRARGVFAQAATSEDISQELDDSNEARAALDVPLVDAGSFTSLRPPGNAANVVAQFVEAMGIEQFYVEDVLEI